MSNNEEKRRFPRSPVHLVVKYKFEGEPEIVKPIISVSKDIGLGGIKLRLKEAPPAGRNIIAQINIPAFDNPVNVVLRVVWVRPAEETDSFDVGTEFIDINKEERSDFLDYINFVNKESAKNCGPGRKSGGFLAMFVNALRRIQ